MGNFVALGISVTIATVLMVTSMVASGTTPVPLVQHYKVTSEMMECTKLKGWAADACVLEVNKRR